MWKVKGSCVEVEMGEGELKVGKVRERMEMSGWVDGCRYLEIGGR